jgi:hypothetical protein
MEKKMFVLFGLLALSAVFLALAASLPGGVIFDILKIPLLLIAIVFDVLAFSSRYYTYLILPLFEQRRRNVVLSTEQAYWLSTTSDAIMTKEGDDFVATMYINIPLYASSTEMSDEEKLAFSKQVSSLVGISKDPVRFTTELYVMNKDSYIQRLRDMINTVENEESALEQKSAGQNEIERARGKLSMWRRMLDNVSKGTSLELISFASLSARGTKEFEAINIAQLKAKETMSGIGALLGVSPSIVIGDELLKFVEPEFLIPYSTISEQISKNIQEQVV